MAINSDVPLPLECLAEEIHELEILRDMNPWKFFTERAIMLEDVEKRIFSLKEWIAKNGNTWEMEIL